MRKLIYVITVLATVVLCGCAYHGTVNITALSNRSVSGKGKVETEGGAAVQVPLPTP